MGREDRVRRRLLGIFLLLFGLATLLAGGACTVLIIALVADFGLTRDASGFMLLALFTFAVGVAAIWQALRLFRSTGAAPDDTGEPPQPPMNGR